MKKWLAVIGVILVAVAIPAVAFAATGGFSSALDQQSSRWTTTAVTTSSTTFATVPGLSGPTICSQHQVTATVSVQLDGGPVGLQVRQDGGGLMQPGAVRFVPAGAQDSVSFTFVQNTGPFENNDHHSFAVEWRSVTGAPVKLVKGDLNLQYETGTHGC
ncbi:MAG TPA: hypothetical protein VGH85_11905 [Mycobacteriales bacterium]|jgi:hypothetical protein